mgnify:FL=1
MSAGNKALGDFNLTEIPPSPRGMPQIEVTFDIDANGKLHVSAKDKATGKENKITIQASSGISEDEIERMIKDAEINAEEDKKAKELVESRNQLDGLVHSLEKSIQEHSDKLEADQKTQAEAAIKKAKNTLENGDKAQIDLEMQELGSISQKIYEKTASQNSANEPKGSESEDKANSENTKDDKDIIDAEFEEVKEEGKK